MTREEAIKILEYPVKKWSMEWDEREDGLSYYEALDMAISALRQQEHFRDLTKKMEPLTLEELVELGIRAENGENIIVYCTPLNDWAKVFKFGLLFFGTEDYRSWQEIEEDYGKTWLAYRQKPEEGTV